MVWIIVVIASVNSTVKRFYKQSVVRNWVKMES